MSDWHSMDREVLLRELSTSRETGLTEEEADSRAQKYGPNALAEAKRKGTLQRFLDQFRGFLVILLIVAAVVSAAFREFGDAIAILVIVAINAVLGVVQENKAENALEALKRMTNPKARALRSGRVSVVDASALVPGDVVLLEAGDLIPADIRIIESASLKIEEAAITGESIPAEKDASAVLGKDAGLGDRVNMAYMGTTVVYGRGRGVVVQTGMSTQVGRIAGMLQQQEDEKTPLQVATDKLGKVLGIAAVAISLLVFAAGLIRGEEPLDMFMTAVSLAVAAIPEGLTAIFTIILAIGVQRMARHNAIIRRLPAVETLGSANVICSDKTGTLTTNRMTVKKLRLSHGWVDVTGDGYSPEGDFRVGGNVYHFADDGEFIELMRCAALCNDATFEKGADGGFSMVGDPTEGCLLVAASKAGIWKSSLQKQMPRVAEVPFDSVRKRMSTLNSLPGGGIRIYTKGAPDEVLKICGKALTDDGVIEMDGPNYSRNVESNDAMAESGMRVLAFAYKDVGSLPAKVDEAIESGMTFIGLAGMQDPARPETAPAVESCHRAGIIPVMITGDHKSTAVAIARQVGIADQDSLALTGSELDRYSEAELLSSVERVRVYARVSPEHKVRIVDAWKSKGYIVAMTGDGVNDAPALKKADIGVAMGITGTDVSKGAADMILTDDNFATIVRAIEEGRTIFDNIKKSVQYLVRCNIGEIVLIFASIVAGLTRPLLPIQILWVNLVTDSLPALALGVDPAEKGIMERRPRGGKDPILGRRLLATLVVHGVLLGMAAMASFLIGERYGAPWFEPGVGAARTMCLVTLTFGQLLAAFSVSSSGTSIFKAGILRNPNLLKAVILSGGIQLAAIYVPFVASFLKLVPLSLGQLGAALGLALLMVPVAEALKAAAGASK
ncbi:MAG TPA: cation-translocating P-type ATPase [Bacillota bacterium]|nr:cation-translocating P-type ATPase [Bacillota bacterium]